MVRKLQFIALATFIAALSAPIAGEQGGGVIRRDESTPQSGRDIERSAVKFSAPWRPGGAGTATRVIGTVIDIRQIPVAHAKVQLRNLDTGAVEGEVEANENGEYGFELENSGTFVVEMVMVDGLVVALSNAGSLGRYETMTTVVQLPGRWDAASRSMSVPQSMTNFFGMSSETTMTATTLQLATEQSVRPADPGTPVSPS